MARKLVAVSTVSHYSVTNNVTPTTSTSANGWVIPNDGATYLYIDNSGSAVVSNFTVLLTQGADVNLTVGPRLYAVNALTICRTGFFPIKLYGPQILITADNNTPGISAYSFSATGAQDF